MNARNIKPDPCPWCGEPPNTALVDANTKYVWCNDHKCPGHIGTNASVRIECWNNESWLRAWVEADCGDQL